MNSNSDFLQLRELIASGAVSEVLASIAPGVSLSCQLDGQQRVFGSLGEDASPIDMPVDIGCVGRTITSLLVAVAVSEGRLAYDDNVCTHFPLRNDAHKHLKIFHLLNHSHGLDGSEFEVMPQKSDGFIDQDQIWNAVDASPMTQPGEYFYYYAAVGIWLAAAILENIYQTAFRTLFHNLLLRFNITSRSIDCGAVCPATGGISMSSRELLALCLVHLDDHRDERLNKAILQLRSEFPMPIPKRPTVGRSSGPGLFCYNSSTHGVFGRGNGSSSLLLISPSDRAAVAVTTHGENTIHLVRQKLFGSLLGSQTSAPLRLLTKAERIALRPDCFVGRYPKASLLLELTCSTRGEIAAAIYPSSKGETGSTPLVARILLPTIENTFFPTRPDTDLMPYVKVAKEGRDGRFQYAFTWKHIFRRIE